MENWRVEPSSRADPVTFVRFLEIITCDAAVMQTQQKVVENQTISTTYVAGVTGLEPAASGVTKWFFPHTGIFIGNQTITVMTDLQKIGYVTFCFHGSMPTNVN